MSETVSPSKSRAPREHLVEHAAEGPDVGAAVHGVPAGLLGAHVRRGAEDHAGHRSGRGQRRGHGRVDLVRRRGGVERLGQPEVEHLDRARRAVSLTLAGLRSRWITPLSWAASRPSAICLAISSRLVERERPPCEPLREILALDQLHRQEAIAAVLVQTVDRGDVRVVQRGQQLRLALEAGEPLGVAGEASSGRTLIATSRSRVVSSGFPDDTHPALADLLDQAVVEQLLARFDRHCVVRLLSAEEPSLPPRCGLLLAYSEFRRERLAKERP